MRHGPCGVAPPGWRKNRASGLRRFGESFRKEITAKETATMAIVNRPPESANRSLSPEPVSELLDDYSKFVDCTPDYLANFASGKTLARDPGYRKWKAS